MRLAWPGRRLAAPALLLRNLAWHSAGRDGGGDLRVAHGQVVERGRGLCPRRGERVLVADGLLALPGLINGHDHLGLDLFPRLGTPPYASAYQWGREIHRPERSPLRELLRVPLADRLRWGGYKNLIGGATTVLHHDPYARRVFGRGFPVRVPDGPAWAHSLGHDPALRRRFARSRGRPFVVHAAEGVDARAAAEVDELDRLGVLGPTTVLVHALAVTERQIARLARAGASVVWCPSSNQYLYGHAAPIDRMKRRVRVALGTDSTLSGASTLLHELRAAAATGQASPEELLVMVTGAAASIFGLGSDRGSLRDGAPADLLLLPHAGGTAAQTLLGAAPADLVLVLVAGAPHLATPAIAASLDLGAPTATVEGKPRWLAGDVTALRTRIAATAGTATAGANPLWALLGSRPFLRSTECGARSAAHAGPVG